MKRTHFLFFVSLLLCTQQSFALRLSIRQGSDGQARVVAVGEENVKSTLRKRSALRLGSERRASLALVKDGAPQPLVFAYRKAGRIIRARKALRNADDFCSDGGVKAYTAVKGRNIRLRVSSREQGDISLYRGSLGKSRNRRRDRRNLSARNLTGLVPVQSSNCLPSGNGLTLGVGQVQSPADRASSSQRMLLASDLRAEEEIPTGIRALDADRDGLADVFDADVDNDGILNNFDSEFEIGDTSYYVFSNLKIDLENTVNVNTGAVPTEEEIDSIVNTMTLAIEVKGEESAAEVSELDCDGLTYCTAGGTGENINDVANPTAFPGTAGGENDLDGDGLGDISVGSTGDFQLRTNANASDIQAGDTFVQLVTASDGSETEYIASLQFTYNTTPALKSVTVAPDSAGESTTNFSYPVSSGSEGTRANCLDVDVNDEGDVVLDITAWRPQRRGISALGEADFVDIGNARVSIEIPNGPTASLNSGSASAGPGMCPIDTYATEDTNLTADGDSLQDSLGDTDADVSNTVSFTLNLTECLASASQTLQSGQKLLLGLQFRNDVGDNAAQNFCVERP